MISPIFTKRIKILAFHLLFLPAFINAQEKDEKLAEQKKLERQVAESKTVPAKIENASKLAEFHLTRKNTEAGDSLLQLMYKWGKESGKKENVFSAYRWAGFAYINSSNLEKGLAQYQQALEYASKERMPNEEILALSLIGRRYAFSMEYDKAMEYFNRVDLNKEGIHDSTRYNYYYRKASLYFNQEKMLEGIKCLLSAKKYAERINNFKSIADANHALGENYKKINEYEKAIACHEIAKKYYEKNADTIFSLAQIYFIASNYRAKKNYPAAKELFEKVIRLADSANMPGLKYSAVVGLWGIYFDQNELVKGAETGKKYKLEDYFARSGDSASLYNLKAVYAEIDSDHDSADWYYRKSIGFTYTSQIKTLTAGYFYIYADYLKRFKRYADALVPMKTALAKYDSLHSISRLPLVYQNLDSIYTALGDYKNAWQARGNYYLYRDSLDNLSKKEDILREEIAAEEERMAKAEEAEIKATERKHDIQYRFIILGAILLLIGLLTIGFFHPPQWLIRGLTFVSFIFIFEFIILILDSKLHHWFHGAPLPILGVKVLIACMLVPLHHLVEKKVIHFLQSKKLHRLKTVFKDDPQKTV
jgi:tetratricopeptide (TPR) repeat protein